MFLRLFKRSIFRGPEWDLNLFLFGRYVITSRTDIVCYFLIILNLMLTASMLSLVLPLAVFLWATIIIPRPAKFFWTFAIIYLEVWISSIPLGSYRLLILLTPNLLSPDRDCHQVHLSIRVLSLEFVSYDKLVCERSFLVAPVPRHRTISVVECHGSFAASCFCLSLLYFKSKF